MTLSLTKPTVGSDAGTWGTILNTALDAIETEVNQNETDIETLETADHLQKAGGVMSGELEFLTLAGDVVAVGTHSGAYELKVNENNGWTFVITGATTFTITGETASKMYGIVLRISNPGTNLTFPASVQWAGGVAPTFTVSGVDVVGLVTLDGGTTWLAGAQLDVS